ncbi:putative G-protein coupled receptor [Armadillidium vulgare]|nr:putative G-protein coupled receptor [Armadillidium vulgare]
MQAIRNSDALTLPRISRDPFGSIKSVYSTNSTNFEEDDLELTRRIAYQIIAPIIVSFGLMGNILTLLILRNPMFKGVMFNFFYALAFFDLLSLLFSISALMHLLHPVTQSHAVAVWYSYLEVMFINGLMGTSVLIVVCITEIIISFLPIVIVLILNCLLVKYFVEKHKHQFYDSQNHSRTENTPKSVRETADKNLKSLLRAIIIAFLITILPAGVFNAAFSEKVTTNLKYEIFRATANNLELLNHALNFYLYILLSKPIRAALPSFISEIKSKMKGKLNLSERLKNIKSNTTKQEVENNTVREREMRDELSLKREQIKSLSYQTQVSEISNENHSKDCEIPEVPDTPEVPYTPKAPDVPDVPKVPEFDEISCSTENGEKISDTNISETVQGLVTLKDLEIT